ncbi:pseudouridine synthase [Mesorhizobium microcysteis]|uniref:Pseudouridine synthase n=1 Tax=Neoaquamicrobium microcysteis TaxID=2682781 RepID=A0A5D4GXK2_9HYPH|nr:pseudouridine synthase [Mesorhizobium microcysteis]TYR31995.1 pseudouridine synthase [Mesorhizobium microcysteis]
MNDDTKKPPRGGAGRGPRREGGDRKPFRPREDGDRPPYAKAEGAKRPYQKRDDRPAGEGGDRKPFRPREDGDRKPFRKDGDRPPYAKAEGAKRPYQKRDDRPAGEGGDRKPFRKREDGERRPYAKADGEKRPFQKRDDRPAGESGARKPFRPREDGDRKPFRKDGDRPPYAKAEGDKRPYQKRDDRPAREGDDRKPFRKREDGERRPYAKAEGERKPFRKRDGDDFRGPRPGRREREGAAEATGTGADTSERIARRLARAGVASRRDAEDMIAAGRVSLNGKVLDSPAVNVSPTDRIQLDGKDIPDIERTRLFLFHKPAGVVTTNRDPEGRKTVFDILPKKLPRLMTVGRLDINTEGLLLLTNDGGLSRVLELPATGWLRRYRVRVHGKVEPEALEQLKEGVAVDGVFYGAVEATLDREQGSNAWLTIGLREGKNREVKNILGSLGLDVTRLIRISYGPFQLGELAEGEVRELKGKLLRDQLGERLIEESGANFEAPILNEFSNKPVSERSERKREEASEMPRNRKREREQKREDALGRLQTKPMRGGGPRREDGPKRFGGGGKPGGREDRPEEKQRSRTANVWMAPGARPMGEKKAAAVAERNEGKRYAGKPRPAGKGGNFAGGPKGPRKPRGDR